VHAVARDAQGSDAGVKDVRTSDDNGDVTEDDRREDEYVDGSLMVSHHNISDIDDVDNVIDTLLATAQAAVAEESSASVTYPHKSVVGADSMNVHDNPSRVAESQLNSWGFNDSTLSAIDPNVLARALARERASANQEVNESVCAITRIVSPVSASAPQTPAKTYPRGPETPLRTREVAGTMSPNSLSPASRNTYLSLSPSSKTKYTSMSPSRRAALLSSLKPLPKLDIPAFTPLPPPPKFMSSKQSSNDSM
jgi:hypothetical protein